MEQTIKRFITCHVPVTACNFNCQYCYIRNIKEREINKFILEPVMLAEKLSPERLGGICYFNFCADGETMLQPQLIELIHHLTKAGHYADIITNGTLTNKFEELIKYLSEDEQKHLMIKFSFHYLELKKKKLLEKYVSNVNLIKKSNISYSIEITPHDELVEYISEIKEFSISNFGALPHITVARNADTREIALLTEYDRDHYKEIWGQFDSPMFDFKFSTFNHKRKEFCYAGDWSIKLDLGSGEYRQCYVGRRLGNICDEGELVFQAIGHCRMPHCFNGHAFLALGDIPELSAPTYAQERDRACVDGTHWLKEGCQCFFSTKLYNNNEEYSPEKKKECLNQTRKDIVRDKTARIVQKMKEAIKPHE